MKPSRIISCVFIICLFTVASAFADGLPIKNGRYSGGSVIVIKLTAKQQKIIKSSYKPYMEIKITKKQQAYIAKEAHMTEPPTKIILARPVDTEHDCTCGLANVGLIFKEGSVEIPIEYLTSDKEAEEMKIDD